MRVASMRTAIIPHGVFAALAHGRLSHREEKFGQNWLGAARHRLYVCVGPYAAWTWGAATHLACLCAQSSKLACSRRRVAPPPKCRRLTTRESRQTVAASSAHSLTHLRRVGDPTPDAYAIAPSTTVVLSEGNYLLLDKPGWRTLKDDVFDATVFIDIDIDTAMQRWVWLGLAVVQCSQNKPCRLIACRVAKRHQEQMGMSAAEADQRVENNDRPNAEEIVQKRLEAHLIV